MRITFTETVVYETEGPGKGPTFKSGSTHDLRDDIAQRWLRRDVAVPAATPEPIKPEPDKTASPDKVSASQQQARGRRKDG